MLRPQPHSTSPTGPTGSRPLLSPSQTKPFAGRRFPADQVVVCFGQSLYSDRIKGATARTRAYEQLGFPGGDDDPKSDDDWQAVAEASAPGCLCRRAPS